MTEIARHWTDLLSTVSSRLSLSVPYRSAETCRGDILSAFRSLACDPPNSLVDLYVVADGSEFVPVFPVPTPFAMACGIQPVSEMVRSIQTQVGIKNLDAYTDESIQADAKVRRTFWDHGWLPFASDGSGDFICVDMNPTATGVIGQVVFCSHELPLRKLLATSLEEYLIGIIESLRIGELEVDERYGVVSRATEESRPTLSAKLDIQAMLQRADRLFKEKHYDRFVRMLEKHEHHLSGQHLAKLQFARRQIKTP